MARFRFADDDYYDRHLVFDHVVPLDRASTRERFEALASSVRDLLSQRWLLTGRTHDERNPKQVYYLSMEFLIGRTLQARSRTFRSRTSCAATSRRTPRATGTRSPRQSPTPG